MNTSITIETTVHKDIQTVWACWSRPEHIQKWMHASDDWECPYAENDLRVGGKFLSRLAAKDKSVSFDIVGTYTEVEQYKTISYTMEDERVVRIIFSEIENGVRVVETFDMEQENSEELQRSGWQAVLDNFKKYIESQK